MTAVPMQIFSAEGFRNSTKCWGGFGLTPNDIPNYWYEYPTHVLTNMAHICNLVQKAVLCYNRIAEPDFWPHIHLM